MRSNARAYRLDDPPAPGHSADRHGCVATEDDPPGDFVLSSQAVESIWTCLGPLFPSCGRQKSHDDPHGFLSVIGSMSEAVKRSRSKLQVTKPALRFIAFCIVRQPAHKGHNQPAEDHADDG